MKISILSLQGMAPKMSPHQLPDMGAQEARNARLTSGTLRPMNKPLRQNLTLVANAVSVFMFGPSGSVTTLSWPTDTDVARSPVADSEHRIYYTNGVAPKKTYLAIAGATGGAPTLEYNMGVPAPATAPTLASSGAGSITETRVYVVTHISTFGMVKEESAPSPFATINLASSSGVALSSIPQPAVTAGYNFTKVRIYRSSGITLQLVVELNLGVLTYTDTLTASQILGDALASTGWLPPPADLKGLVTLPAGSLAGFRNNEIWFSEPGFPHAWPAKYMQPLDSQLVAIKAFGNNLAIGTQAHPYVGSGLHPDSFTFQKIPRLEPCVSKRSMAADEYGAVYASQNGLISIGLDGDSLATSEVFTRIEFAEYAPTSLTGAVFEGRYYGFYNTGQRSGAFVFSKVEHGGVRTLETPATAACVEPGTAQLMFVDATDNKLYAMDPVNTLPMSYYWKSKLFNVPAPVNFSYIQVHSREASAVDAALRIAVAAANVSIDATNAGIYATGNLKLGVNVYELNNGALNDSSLQPLLPFVQQTVGVYVYAGGDIKFAKDLEFNHIYALPSGFKNLGFEIALSGQREVSSVEMATSIKEMKSS